MESGFIVKLVGVIVYKRLEPITEVIIKSDVPVFFTEIESILEVPVLTFPKFKFVGVAVKIGETPLPETIIVSFGFSALCVNVFAQTKSYPFEVIKTGKEKQAILFIPGFASSGEVWNETKIAFEKDFTCYTLTMAGFAGAKPHPNPSFENWKAGIATYIKTNKNDITNYINVNILIEP